MIGRETVRLSVVIPTLGELETARLLGERVRALLGGLSTEVIIISPKAIEASGPSNVRYARDRGRGVYAAYTQGLRMAHGEYIWFIGDDDYPLDTVAELAPIIERNEADLLIGPVILSTGRVYRPSRSRLLLLFRNWCQQGVVYRRALFRNRPFFGRMRTQADHYVNVRLRLDARVRMIFLRKPLCVFGTQGISSRNRVDRQFLAVRTRLARRYLRWFEFLTYLLLLCVRRVLLSVRGVTSIRQAGSDVSELR